METSTEWAQHLLQSLLLLIEQMGYGGLFLMTFIESTVVPLPIEATLIPAGYLVQQGKMAFMPALIVSVLGALAGSCVNYWLARRFGRHLFLRYGKWLLMNEAKLMKIERFFASHGAISTFTGRLLPGFRHCIALPAGLARMHMPTFLLCTALGSAIWSGVLLGLGYVIGSNEAMAMHYLPMLKMGTLVFVLLGIGAYMLYHRRKHRD